MRDATFFFAFVAKGICYKVLMVSWEMGAVSFF